MFKIIYSMWNYVIFETIRTAPSNSYGGNFFTITNRILSLIDYTILTIMCTLGFGNSILPNQNFWQILENYNLSFVSFFIIFGALELEIYATSGTSKSNLIAMFFVFLFLLIRIFVFMHLMAEMFFPKLLLLQVFGILIIFRFFMHMFNLNFKVT